MDPQIKSILTSIIAVAAGGAATWGVDRGLVPAMDKTQVSDAIGYAILTLLTGGLSVFTVWLKSRTHTPTAQIAAVNEGDNGVKVVAATAPVNSVDKPLKGAES